MSLRIVVQGYIVRGPLGGMVWHHLQYVLGLKLLGHDVYFIEDSDDYPSCYNPETLQTTLDPDYGLRFATSAFAGIGLGDCWAYYDAHTARWLGPCAERAQDICRTADLLINVSGVNPIRRWVSNIPVRVLIDTDPVFTQVRNLTEPHRRELSTLHNRLFSFGENIGTNSTIPDDGLAWKPTRQPVVLDCWPEGMPNSDGPFTTIMQWDSYRTREYKGVSYGMKSESFSPYLTLPATASGRFQLAIGAKGAVCEMLRSNGWDVVDPLTTLQEPWMCQAYMVDSKAEFSIAKHGYVLARTGWFSERSCGYMAVGRPVLVQETGFSDWLETGRGVLAFSTPDEALAGIDEINSRYVQHCKWAREIVREYFDYRQVLGHLVESAMHPMSESVR